MMTTLAKRLPGGCKNCFAFTAVAVYTAAPAQVQLRHNNHYLLVNSRHAQTPSSAVGPNAFYVCDTKDDHMKSEKMSISMCNEKENQSKVASVATPAAVLKRAYLIIQCENQTPSPCVLRTQLQILAPKMKERVFFYNEKNPHVGLILNIKEYIYNYYKMMGPLKGAWYQILTQHSALTTQLTFHLHQANRTTDYDNSLGALVQLLESVESKRDISSCKFEKSVREGQNLIQFKYDAFRSHEEELIALQVLAQYAYYDYEII